ncbi:MAG TPA: hypothetical protein VLA49_14780 [Anaerolineales bacterium]|nr:hypothetical protein [Anaerolineales bacterium]
MLFQVSALILILWLLSVAWLDTTKTSYIYWAGLVIFLWWLAWYRRQPPLLPKSSHRVVVYVVYIGAVVAMAVFINNPLVLLLLIELVVLMGVDIRFRQKKANGDEVLP